MRMITLDIPQLLQKGFYLFFTVYKNECKVQIIHLNTLLGTMIMMLLHYYA